VEEALQVLQTLAVYNGKKMLLEEKLKKGEVANQSTITSSIFDLFSFSAICTMQDPCNDGLLVRKCDCVRLCTHVRYVLFW